MEDYGIYLLIGDYLNEDNFRAIQALTKKFHIVDLADLMNHLKNEDALKLFKYYDTERQAVILTELNLVKQDYIVSRISNLSKIISLIESDDAADLVGFLDKKEQDKVLVSVEIDEAEDLRELLKYPKNSAGGIMSKEIIFVRYSASVAEAIFQIRKAVDESDQIYHVFIVSHDMVLLGTLELNQLLLAKTNTKVKDIMKNVQSVQVDVTQEEVSQIVSKYDLVEVPVVDLENHLVGRITHDDVLDVVEEESDKDIAYLSGIREELSHTSTQSILQISRGRISWILLGLFGGILSAIIMGSFGDYLQQFIFLSFFVPVIMAMGGIVGIQCSTITVRGLATDEIILSRFFFKVFQEMTVTLVTGVICSLVISGVVYFWGKDFRIVQVVVISMFLVMMISTFLGTTIPILFHRLKVDPAIATGPFVTTFNDIIALSIYLSIAFYTF